MLTNGISINSSRNFSSENGKLSRLSGLDIEWVNEGKQVYSNQYMTMTRQTDMYGRLESVKAQFGPEVKFSMFIDYDKMGRIHEWKHRIGREKEIVMEYIYNVDSHVKEVLLEGQ